jgi:ribosomal protein L13
MEIEDDAEWGVVSERIVLVSDLRKIVQSTGSRGSPGGKKESRAKTDGSSRSEQDALRAAVRDKLPDAEIKARLARAHEVYRQNEAKLTQAQSNLRAVLTVRQEAVAVMAGLLPP